MDEFIELWPAAAAIAGGYLGGRCLRRAVFGGPPAAAGTAGTGYLDAPVFSAPCGVWRRRDACQNALLLGATGSGKSSLLRWILPNLLRGGGALLICAKATDRADYEAILRGIGRTPLVLDGTGPGLNFFDAVLTPDLDPADRGLAGERAWEAVAAVVNREARRTASGDNAFFVASARALVRFAVDLLTLADVPVTADAVLRVCRWLPNSPADLSSERWKGGFLNECLAKAYARRQGQDGVYRAASEFFTVQMAGLADRTRGGVVSEVAATGDILTRGACRRLLSDGRLKAADLVAANEVVILDTPFMTKGDVGRACGAGVKFAFQQALLRRPVGPDTPLFPIVCDEFQEVVTEEDAAYTAVCRGQRAPLVVATQCLNSLVEKFGSNGKEKAEVLIGNLSSRFVCNPTPHVAKWVVENLIGRTRQTFYSGNSTGSAYSNPWELATGGQPTASAGFSQQMDYAVQFQDLFELRMGGPPDFTVECLWFQAGRQFAGGSTYGYLAVSQRGA